MQTLQTLVRNLTIILLLATVLELLLPGKSMVGFVRLVMGLFVISAILNPVTQFLHLNLAMDVPAWAETMTKDLPAMADENGQKVGKDLVQEQYQQILANQVRALALEVSGVKDAQVEVHFKDNNSGSITEQPQISSVNITISLSDKVKPVQPIQPVQPIEIDPGTEKSTSPQPLSAKAEEVRDHIAALMELPKEKIVISEN